MSIFKFLDYRDYLRTEINERKKKDPTINYKNIAESVRVQTPFISKVINLHAHFSSDQCFLVCRYLNLENDELAFFNLLHSYQTTGIHERKDFLLKKINDLKSKNTGAKEILKDFEPKNRVPIEFRVDPLLHIVKIGLSIPRYNENLNLLAKDTGIPIKKIESEIDKLIQTGIAERKDSGFIILEKNMVISKNERGFEAWFQQLRSIGVFKYLILPDDQKFSLIGVFSGDDQVKEYIQSGMVELMTDARKFCTDRPKENIYQFSFDIFNWSK